MEASIEPLSWVALLTLMVHPPDPEPTVRGSITSFDGADESRGNFGWTAYANAPLPVFAGRRPGGLPAFRVWRDGARMRIEEPDGSISLIVGDDVCWRFDREHDAPVASPQTAVRYEGSGTQLLTRREPAAFVGTDFTRPTGPVAATTFLGRPAWTVELAPPRHKPHPMQLVVDAETGLVLQQRNDGLGSVDEWVEFVVGEPIDAAQFTWDGPVRTDEDQRAVMMAEHDALVAERRRWFADHVSTTPLRVEFELEVSTVHEYDESGSFQATIGRHGVGIVARRPHSDQPWELGWHEIDHRWSTAQWDWAVQFPNLTPTAASLASLEQQLNG